MRTEEINVPVTETDTRPEEDRDLMQIIYEIYFHILILFYVFAFVNHAGVQALDRGLGEGQGEPVPTGRELC